MKSSPSLEQARNYVRSEKYDKALVEYERYVKLNGRSAQIQLELSLVYEKKGDAERAAQASASAAEVLHDEGSMAGAIAAYERAVTLAPDSVDNRLRLAGLLPLAGKNTQALAELQEAADRATSFPQLLRVRRRIAELSTEDPKARLKVAEVLAAAGRHDEANAVLDQAARYFRQIREVDSEREILERLSTRPELVPLHARRLARLYLNAGEPQRALSCLARCYLADPESLDTLSLLAESFEKAGQFDHALITVNKFAERSRLFGIVIDGGRVKERLHSLAERARATQRAAQRRPAMPPRIPDDALAAPEKAPPERRAPRMATAEPVRVRFSSNRELQIHYLRDISKGGVFIISERLVPLGSVIVVTLIAPDGEEIELPGKVVRVVTAENATATMPMGIGVQFFELSAEVQLKLESYLTAVQSSLQQFWDSAGTISASPADDDAQKWPR